MESAQHREGNRQRVRTEGRWYYEALHLLRALSPVDITARHWLRLGVDAGVFWPEEQLSFGSPPRTSLRGRLRPARKGGQRPPFLCDCCSVLPAILAASFAVLLEGD